MEPRTRTTDIVVFGSTSFTGKWVIHEILKALDNGDNFSWSIAGRSIKKMDDLLKEISKETGKNYYFILEFKTRQIHMYITLRLHNLIRHF